MIARPQKNSASRVAPQDQRRIAAIVELLGPAFSAPARAAGKAPVDKEPAPLAPDAPVLLRTEEAARMLGIGRSKMCELVAAKQVPVIRMGRVLRIPREALMTWVTENTVKPLDDLEWQRRMDGRRRP